MRNGAARVRVTILSMKRLATISDLGTVEKLCLRCGIRFLVRRAEVNRGNGKFCSRSCCANWERPEGLSSTATRRRARNLWINRNCGAHPVCRICFRKADIHHINGDPADNSSDNHDRLCRSHHVTLENRLFPRRKRLPLTGVGRRTRPRFESGQVQNAGLTGID